MGDQTADKQAGSRGADRTGASPFRTILVALDATPRAQAVLAAAVDLAQRFGSELTVMRAVGMPTEIPPEALREPYAEVPDILETRARRDLDALAATVPPTVAVSARVQLGVPWEAICSAAREARVDLVVVGTHGLHGIERLLGSTAARVVNHCERPVLVVPDAPPASDERTPLRRAS